MPVLLVIGSGPGISHATARRFGAEGYRIALVGRDRDRVDAGAARLRKEGLTANAYVSDAADPSAARTLVDTVRADLGPITVVLFTAFGNSAIQNVLEADPLDSPDAFQLGVAGLLAVVQATVGDLRAEKGSAILAANGAVGEDLPEINGFVTSAGLDGLALESAAKSKLLGLLAERLRDENVFVGEIMINGTIQGSPYATPTAIDPADVAERFWEISTARVINREQLVEGA